MLSVLRVHLPSDIPIVGCELTPYVLLRRPDKTVTTEDVPESTPLDGHFLRYKWYRIQSDKKVAICSVHPSEQATLQCLGCVKAKIPVAKSYHCSTKCFSDAWQHHRVLHERAASAVNENGAEEDELFGRFNSAGSGVVNASLPASQSNPSLSNGAAPVYPAAVAQRSGGETWFEVGRSKTYTPTADDIGHVLKLECFVVDVETKLAVGLSNTVLTSRVIPAPSPCPRRLIPVSGVDVMGHLDSDGHISTTGTFTVLSYNILSDAYATSESYSYCPSWALSWPYRRQNLLREIVGYRADIVCLQEVQSDHFEEFFGPELDKHGYQALFKRKTAEVFNGNINTIDGCATFFRRDRFSHVKKYEVEFNKAAQSLTDALVPSVQKKTALSRLVKDNVALIVVLEAKFINQVIDNPGKRQLVCVANTHVNVHQDLKDVKLWQVHTLLKGLEKIAASANIPMLVCGDFNAIPGSAPHALLAMGKVDPMHPDLVVDPLGILRPLSKLAHQLPLVSAYSSFARMGVGLGLEQHRRRMDPSTNEPLFTNCTRDFIGTLDYIFYSADSLTVESLLELLDEDSLRKDTALPSPEWSSDHIALLAEFRCMPRTRR
ncbi:carbon catabolite repressor protein 4 homolog 1-like [Rhododendron vialii]|uniref:carbon catabolite repressor protein 4 homolog 1-like n=1 Tax=Rhododendron vialii TaxID=182163 RepID=UPI00265DC032|nr:carbon catabolite repressor protein 4 homolog 1-like [Rhododendron vialii]XP_058204834.1 carbon catabolite repressor protein 4 homolog 1-like [Rhododendron vialii]